MTLILELPPYMEARLRKEATELGKSVEARAYELLESACPQPDESPFKRACKELAQIGASLSEEERASMLGFGSHNIDEVLNRQVVDAH